MGVRAWVRQWWRSPDRDLTQRVARLEQALTRAGHALDVDERQAVDVLYAAFEERYRGSSAEIETRLRPYVALFDSRHHVLDIGCGRGELLTLLREAPIPARGVDTNQVFVESCQKRGLDAVCADARDYLRASPPEAFGAVTFIHVLEHLPFAYLAAVLALAYSRLKPGGVLVAETVNVSASAAFIEVFLRDPTHVTPLHPDTLQHLLSTLGFTEIEVRMHTAFDPYRLLARVPPADTQSVPGLNQWEGTLNRNVEFLNEYMFRSQEYVVTARRPPS